MEKKTFIFMADQWNPKDLEDSRYIWLLVEFEKKLPADVCSKISFNITCFKK